MTLSLSDELYSRAQDAAQAQGTTVAAFVSEAVQAALLRQSLKPTLENGLPTMVVPEGTPPIDVTAVRDSLAEEGF